MKLKMPDGREVEQSGPEDRATWWTCKSCGFTGPAVGSDPNGEHRCMGIICGGRNMNPNTPKIDTSPLRAREFAPDRILWTVDGLPIDAKKPASLGECCVL